MERHHTAAVRSVLQVTAQDPFGLMAAAVTHDVWPARVARLAPATCPRLADRGQRGTAPLP